MFIPAANKAVRAPLTFLIRFFHSFCLMRGRGSKEWLTAHILALCVAYLGSLHVRNWHHINNCRPVACRWPKDSRKYVIAKASTSLPPSVFSAILGLIGKPNPYLNANVPRWRICWTIHPPPHFPPPPSIIYADPVSHHQSWSGGMGNMLYLIHGRDWTCLPNETGIYMCRHECRMQFFSPHSWPWLVFLLR